MERVDITKIFEIKTKEEFNTLTLEIFHLQAKSCEVYREYIELLGIDSDRIGSIEEIPFLPIRLFKQHNIATLDKSNRCYTNGADTPQITFTSSATTGMTPSRHLVYDPELYRESFTRGFNLFYGNPRDYTILALLPSYLERKGSSLVYMADSLIKSSDSVHKSEVERGGFYLYNYKELYDKLCLLKNEGKKCILLGVSFALLDFIKEFRIEFPDLTVIETGGMKGRGKEIAREELHSILKQGFGVENIHSEYGMAELMSQAYSNGKGIFYTVPWMKIIIRDMYNPLKYVTTGEEKRGIKGGINIIDLANINSCSFIESEDMGELTACGGFMIHGRIKEAELRGCNLLIE